MPKTLDKADKTELTEVKQRAVELWRVTRGHITNLCRGTGVSRQTYYEWLNTDPLFAQAIADAEAELNDDMKEALIQKAADGSSTDIQFYLTRRHPEFRPQPGVQVNTQINNYGDKTSEQKTKYDI